MTGRLKDLIIIHGENYYPQDLEWVVEQSHPALHPGCGAAFAINIDGVEQLVVAFEVECKASKNLNTEEVVNVIRNAIAEHCELSVYSIVLLKRGSILKTSSGNIALEMAQQLKQQGEQVLLVAMSDSPNPLITVEQKNKQWTDWKLYGKAHKRKKFEKEGLSPSFIENIVKVSVQDKKLEMRSRVGFHQKYQNLSKPYESI